MKDHRFIDLLNLYIDRQISAEETAELEAEIQQNPKRQAVYRQYCKIHTASKLVYESFRAGATEQPAAPATGRPATIELFESRRRRANWAYYAGGLAAAACLVVGLMSYASLKTPATSATVAATSRAAAPAVAAPVATVNPAAVLVVAEPVVTPVNLRATVTSPDYGAMLAALREQDEERALANAARTQSLFNDNFFETSHAGAVPDARATRPRPASQAEFTAFQFQR